MILWFYEYTLTFSPKPFKVYHTQPSVEECDKGASLQAPCHAFSSPALHWHVFLRLSSGMVLLSVCKALAFSENSEYLKISTFNISFFRGNSNLLHIYSLLYISFTRFFASFKIELSWKILYDMWGRVWKQTFRSTISEKSFIYFFSPHLFIVTLCIVFPYFKT